MVQDVTLFIDNFCWNGLVFSGCWDGHGDNVWHVGAGQHPSSLLNFLKFHFNRGVGFNLTISKKILTISKNVLHIRKVSLKVN